MTIYLLVSRKNQLYDKGFSYYHVNLPNDVICIEDSKNETNHFANLTKEEHHFVELQTSPFEEQEFVLSLQQRQEALGYSYHYVNENNDLVTMPFLVKKSSVQKLYGRIIPAEKKDELFKEKIKNVKCIYTQIKSLFL